MSTVLELEVLAERAHVLHGDLHTRLPLDGALVAGHALDALDAPPRVRAVVLHVAPGARGRGRVAALHELPERLHVLGRDDLVAEAAEHEDRRLARDERHLGRGVPLLVAEEREGAEHGQRAGHEAREGEEGVLEDERADLAG